MWGKRGQRGGGGNLGWNDESFTGPCLCHMRGFLLPRYLNVSKRYVGRYTVTMGVKIVRLLFPSISGSKNPSFATITYADYYIPGDYL